MTKPSIGHNNGPPIDGPEREPGDPFNLYAWKKAHRAAWRAPTIDALQRRTRRANALGLSYRQFTGVLLDRGRNLTTLIFDLGGTLVRISNYEVALDARGAVMLMPGVREKLPALSPGAMFVLDKASGPASVGDYAAQVGARCNTAFTGSAESNDKASAAKRLLHDHAIVPGEVAMIGDDVEDERCARDAGLAVFVWAFKYFGDRPKPGPS